MTEVQPKRRRRVPVFAIIFLAVQVLFLVWIIGGASGGLSSANDVDCTGMSAGECNDLKSAAQSGAQAGTAIGVALIIALWAATDIILGISYMVVRLSRSRRV